MRQLSYFIMHVYWTDPTFLNCLCSDVKTFPSEYMLATEIKLEIFYLQQNPLAFTCTFVVHVTINGLLYNDHLHLRLHRQLAACLNIVESATTKYHIGQERYRRLYLPILLCSANSFFLPIPPVNTRIQTGHTSRFISSALADSLSADYSSVFADLLPPLHTCIGSDTIFINHPLLIFRRVYVFK